ncbi:hypothetical protein Scuro_36 [Acinetobacter phage Scuro]|nr:hypothetical protein Scuro_36 [Acinetobacter phage Scuro]
MRLNKEIRQKIVDNAYKASPIPAAKKELTSRSVALSERVRLDSLQAFNAGDLDTNLATAEKEVIELLKRRGIPDNFIPSRIFSRDKEIYVGLGESKVTLYFNGMVYKNGRHSYGTIVDGDNWVGTQKFKSTQFMQYDADHEFTQEYRSICNDAKDLETKEKVLRETVKATLDSFYTTERLLEEWPEAKDLIPKEVEAAAKPMPLALQTEELNKLIGLPK